MVLVSIGIVGFLLQYVVPRMVSVYSNIGQTLPFMTQLLIGFSSGDMLLYDPLRKATSTHFNKEVFS